jgi:hypothetical protein
MRTGAADRSPEDGPEQDADRHRHDVADGGDVERRDAFEEERREDGPAGHRDETMPPDLPEEGDRGQGRHRHVGGADVGDVPDRRGSRASRQSPGGYPLADQGARDMGGDRQDRRASIPEAPHQQRQRCSGQHGPHDDRVHAEERRDHQGRHRTRGQVRQIGAGPSHEDPLIVP